MLVQIFKLQRGRPAESRMAACDRSEAAHKRHQPEHMYAAAALLRPANGDRELTVRGKPTICNR